MSSSERNFVVTNSLIVFCKYRFFSCFCDNCCGKSDFVDESLAFQFTIVENLINGYLVIHSLLNYFYKPVKLELNFERNVQWTPGADVGPQ